jgi:hypothetical protein
MENYIEETCMQMIGAPMLITAAMFAFNNWFIGTVIAASLSFLTIAFSCGVTYIREQSKMHHFRETKMI